MRVGFDTDGIVTVAKAAEFFAAGFRFCVRYVSRIARQAHDDLSASEAIDLLNAGLALMPVQHVRAQGWVPSPELGSLDGVHAAYHAFVIGFPTGVNVWCDLEGVSPATLQSRSSVTVMPGTMLWMLRVTCPAYMWVLVASWTGKLFGSVSSSCTTGSHRVMCQRSSAAGIKWSKATNRSWTILAPTRIEHRPTCWAARCFGWLQVRLVVCHNRGGDHRARLRTRNPDAVRSWFFVPAKSLGKVDST